MELNVRDTPEWKTLKTETFDSGRVLIMKQYDRSFQILLMSKDNCDLAEIFDDLGLAQMRFRILVDLIK